MGSFMYGYVKNHNLWVRLSSKSYYEKMLKLFGVKSIEELKACVEKAKFDKTARYENAWESAPNILSYIIVEEIASKN